MKMKDQSSGASRENRGPVPTKEVVLAGLLKSRLYFVDCNAVDCNAAKADAVREANDQWVALRDKLAEFGNPDCL